MDSRIENVLRKVGLTEGEIKVYLALIELGSVTVGPVIKKARVSNSKVYEILDKLIHKGLVNYIIKEKTKYFQAAQPISLKDYVQSKVGELIELDKDLNSVMDLIKLNKNKPKEEARIFRGYNGMKTGMFEAIQTIPEKGEYLFFSKGYGGDPYLQQFFRNLSLELKRRKIKIFGLANTAEKKLFKSYYKKLGYDMRYVPFSWPSDVTVAGEYLIILVWEKEEPVTYLIQSKPLTESYSSFFRSLWERGD